jgi:integrase
MVFLGSAIPRVGKTVVMKTLTQAALKGLAKKPGRHWAAHGLFFRVLPGEKCYWVYRYRASGKVREMSLGPYPELTLAEARAKHADLRKQVVIDKADLIAERDAAKRIQGKASVPTFGKMADDYVEAHEASWRNDKHRAQWRMTLSAYCDAIRDTPVDQIDTAAVLRVLTPIWSTTPETASRLRGRIEAVLAAAQVDGWIEENRANPARWKNWLELKLPNPKKLGERGHHAAMAYAEVPAFMARLKNLPGTSARALAFAVLTAARSGEVFGMTFSEIDLEPPSNGSAATWPGPTWTVPAIRMKMRKEHRVPLSLAAVEIIKAQLAKRGPKQTFVFESPIAAGSKIHREGAHQPLSNMAFAMLLRRMKLGHFTAHGFRSAFRDWVGDETQFQRETGEAALAHLVGDAAERAYRRGDAFNKRRELMNAWASYCFPPEVETKVSSLAGRRRR